MIRPIAITAVLNGYIVSVGCQQVVFNNTETLITELRVYLADPEDTEKRYNDLPNARHVQASPYALGGTLSPSVPLIIRTGDNDSIGP